MERFATLSSAYKVQMVNTLEHLCDINTHDFVIKPRTSFIFTGEDNEDTETDTIKNIEETHDGNAGNHTQDSNEKVIYKNIDKEQDCVHSDGDIVNSCPSTQTEQLLKSTNTQQRFLANFFRQYLAALMQYEDARHRFKNASKPLPFHIVVNGLAGSGKSYVISIIEQMWTDFCISESAFQNRPRRRKGLLKMVHTGKAALNILGG